MWRCLISLLIAVGVLLLLPGCSQKKQAAPTTPDASPDHSSALFEDVTSRAGIHFIHNNGAQGSFRFAEFSSAGCSFLDYDNDGWLDILLIQSGSSKPAAAVTDRPHCALYHNNHDGTFTDVTAGSGLDRDLGYAQGVAVGDIDNDGYDDLFITSYGRNYLFQNEAGTGKYKDITAEWGLDKPHSTGYATSAAFGDYDNDGKLDLYICYYAPWTQSDDKPCFNEKKLQDYCSPELFPPDTHQLFHNEGSHFSDVSEKSGISKVQGRGLAVAFLDYDGDGKQDIYVANDITPNMLWHNNGDGTFTEAARKAGCAYSEEGALMAGMGIASADYNHSGRESLFVTNFSGMPNTLFTNRGNGLFQNDSAVSGLALPHMKFLAFGCGFIDYDADGWPDLFVNNGSVYVHAETRLDGAEYKERKQIFHNEGNGQFKEIIEDSLLGDMAVPMVGRGLAVGDYDNDGRQDVLCSNQNGPPQLFHNQNRNKNHWISFNTIGTKSNRDGLHARFEITSGGIVQTAVTRSGYSYLSASDRRVYFGLGQSAKIEKLKIRWPSGTEETFQNVQPDRFYLATEGKGIAIAPSKGK